MVQVEQIPLTLKIAQMIMVGFAGLSIQPDDAIYQSLMAQELGGVILFDYDYQQQRYGYNIQSPAQLSLLTGQLQKLAKKAAQHHQYHLSPLLIAIDYEGGKVNRLKESLGFPKTQSAYELNNKSQTDIIKIAREMAQTLKNAGININFAPVVDLNINPDNPVIGKVQRSFSADPNRVSELAMIFATIYQQHGILCAYKHFPGHGSSTTDSHLQMVDVSHTWQKIELIPYQDLIKQNRLSTMILTSHVVHKGLDSNGYPASLSYAMTSQLLRDKLQFKGVVVTDDLQMKAIVDHYGLEQAIVLAINAGADILVFGNQLVKDKIMPATLIALIERAVKTQQISSRRIDQSYQRIMAMKANL
jgi:beta-N-acetylhexosaminidase